MQKRLAPRAFFYFNVHTKQAESTKLMLSAKNMRDVGNPSHLAVSGESSTQPLL